MACITQTNLLRTLRLMHSEVGKKNPKIHDVIWGSSGHLLECAQIIKGLLITLAWNIIELELGAASSVAISYTK